MAQDRVLGEQVDIIDLTGDIAADATAIGNLASGIAADPTAAADLAAGMNHADIGTGIGSNTHLQIDTHIADGALHFTTITGLSDVNAPSPTDRDVLVWQNGSSTWIPGVRVENPMISNLDVETFSLITIPPTSSQNTNSITLQGGGNTYSGRTAGAINLYGGDGTVTNYGGAINLVSGSSTGPISSNVTITAGATAYNGPSNGGDVNITGGAGTLLTGGGYVKIRGGSSQQADGGQLWLDGGVSGVTTGKGGGHIFIRGGENQNLSGAYPGGDVNIIGGETTNTGGQSGNINIRPGGRFGNTQGSINFRAADEVGGDEAVIKLWSESGDAHFVALKAPAFAGSPLVDRTWILPQDDPTTVVGYSLTTDAAGVLSFAQAPYVPLIISTDTTTSRSLVLVDAGQMVTMNNAAANTVVVPTNASVAFIIGTEIVISQFGVGQTSFVGEGSPSTVTINSAGGLTSLAEQFSTATIVKTGTDTWLLTGDTV